MACSRLPIMFSLLLSFVPSTALATTFVVDGRANGQFGTYGPSLIRNGLDLVEGEIFGTAGESIELTATGSVYLGTTALPTTGPDGAGPFDRTTFLASTLAYTSIEELQVDLALPLASTFVDVGALFAVFVPEAVAAAGGFLARNVDVGGSIASDTIVLVGSGPIVFTSPEAGRLYFGVNDSFGSNNTGSYTVTGTAVPEPSTATLITLGLLGLSRARRNRRSEHCRSDTLSVFWFPLYRALQSCVAGWRLAGRSEAFAGNFSSFDRRKREGR